MKLMKPILSIFLLSISIGSTGGFQLYAHYCGDFLAGIRILNENAIEDCCGVEEESCSAEQEMNCCAEETHFIQMDVDLLSPKVIETNFDLPILSLLYFTNLELEESSSNLQLNYTSPLLHYKTPIYKKLSRFTLYG